MQCKRVLVMFAVTGCTVGTPTGFSTGDHWTFPLVGPLEDGLLIVPVTVRGQGPYLFAIDPDANVTAIDTQVFEEAQLRGGIGPRRIDETDSGQTRMYAEMYDLKIAGLTIGKRDAMVIPIGLYDAEGRHLHGILGRDAIADSMVFGFDRDQGIAMLSTVKAFRPPPDAIAIRYETVLGTATKVAGRSPSSVAFGMVNDAYNGVRPRINEAERLGARLVDIAPIPRRYAVARIGGVKVEMHLDLGATVSQLRERSWRSAKLTAMPVKLRLVDETGWVRNVMRAATSRDVVLGAAKAPEVTFVPYVERRFATAELDGALGLDFFKPYAVYANWDNRTYYLRPRGDATATMAARLARWGADLPACAHPGCVTVDLDSAGGNTVLHVARDPEATGRGLEVVLGVVPAPGATAASLIVELPREVTQVDSALPTEYAGATLGPVLDVSPFPRTCVGEGGCVLPMGGIAVRTSAEPAAPPAAAPPTEPPPSSIVAALRTVALDKLHRQMGQPEIAPSDDAKKAAAGKPFAVAIVKVCLTADGRVASTKLAKSSGVPAYDKQLQTTIEATWAFEPYATDGAPEPACASATFVSHRNVPGGP